MIDPRIVAHRGFTLLETENTLAAFEAAMTLGCRAIEFDVHATNDGVWVVQHDPTLSRIHGVDLSIAACSLDMLRAEAPVVTLTEALEVFPIGVRPMVEVKPTLATHFDALAEDLARFTPLDPIVIVRGDLPRAANDALPNVPIYLFSENWAEAYARRGEPIAGYDLRHDAILPEQIADECARFAAAGKEVAVWTVDEDALVRQWLEAGVPWVITNRPDQVGMVF